LKLFDNLDQFLCFFEEFIAQQFVVLEEPQRKYIRFRVRGIGDRVRG
jgi:hypothetical protein